MAAAVHRLDELRIPASLLQRETMVVVMGVKSGTRQSPFWPLLAPDDQPPQLLGSLRRQKSRDSRFHYR